MVTKTEPKLNLDEKDRAILKELQDNCRQTFKEISKKIKLPETTVKRRIGQLEKERLIKGYNAILDSDVLGQSAVAFALIKVNQQPLKKGSGGSIPEIMKELSKHDEIQELYSLAGDYDILAKIRARNQKELGEWLMGDFWKVPGMGSSSTLITFSCGKETLKIKVD